MTKAAEIAALDSFIAKLGTASYLGPWLADNREAIVADIRNDLPVDILLPRAAVRKAEETVAVAKQDAARIVREAQDRAQQLRTEAQAQCDTQRRVVADIIARHCAEAQRALVGGR
jgi:cell division septum initiation protein DivIVA